MRPINVTSLFSSINAVETIALGLVFNLFPLLLLLFLLCFRFISTSMAVHAVRSPTTQLPSGISGNLSPSNRNPNAVIRFGYGSSKRNRLVSLSASLREGDGRGKESSVRAVEVKKILEDSPLLPSTNPII